MKTTVTILLLMLCICSTSCNSEKTNEESKTATAGDVSKKPDPLNGAWQTASLTLNGKLSTDKQVKFFNDGAFILISTDTAGKISFAGYGKYELEGNSYQEAFLYHDDPSYIGGQDWQNYEMKGDTLIMTGFAKVIIGGKEVTGDFPKIVEKRVRYK